jgi:hypothetical protein
VREEEERKDVGFPDLHAAGEVDLPEARSGDPHDHPLIPLTFIVFSSSLWHGRWPVLISGRGAACPFWCVLFAGGEVGSGEPEGHGDPRAGRVGFLGFVAEFQQLRLLSIL